MATGFDRDLAFTATWLWTCPQRPRRETNEFSFYGYKMSRGLKRFSYIYHFRADPNSCRKQEEIVLFACFLFSCNPHPHSYLPLSSFPHALLLAILISLPYLNFTPLTSFLHYFPSSICFRTMLLSPSPPGHHGSTSPGRKG